MDKLFHFHIGGRNLEFSMFGVEKLSSVPPYRITAYRLNDEEKQTPYIFLANDPDTLEGLHFVRDFKDE